MWSLSAPAWRVDMSAQRLTLARSAWPWSAETATCEAIHLAQGTPDALEEPWRVAVDALAQWLVQSNQKRPTLQVVLSGRFVRWQLLPWQAKLSSPDELAAYAALRFRETYGKAADDWQVLPAPQPPGETVPACAVDAALVAALRSACNAAGATLAAVTPAYAAAFDRWRSALNKKGAWFGLVEADGVSLGLLRGGQWAALASQRVTQNWRDALPGMMAQMGIAGGLGDAPVPLYLAGGAFIATPPPDAAFTWLQPKVSSALAMQSAARS